MTIPIAFLAFSSIALGCGAIVLRTPAIAVVAVMCGAMAVQGYWWPVDVYCGAGR